MARTSLVIGTTQGVVDLGGNEALAGRRVGPFTSRDGDVAAIADSARVVTFDGDSWREVGMVDDAQCIERRHGEDLYIGTGGAHVERVGAQGPERLNGFEDVPTRDEWYTPWGGPAEVRSLTVTADGTLLANVHVGGILRSTDAGETWKPTIDLHCDVHQVFAHPTRSGLVFAAAAVGLCTSVDDGATWDVLDAGLHATYARGVAFAGDVVLVSVSTGPAGARSAIYRRAIDAPPDRDFERSRVGLPEWLSGNIDTFCLAGDHAGTFAAFGDREGAVFASEDAGTSWEPAASGLAPVVALTLAPS